MSESAGTKKKQKDAGDIARILLIDEPEAFLHPPTIRSARDSLYDFALNNPDWQVIATTHSPILIDLSRDHTTIVRVDPTVPNQHYVSTDKMSFEADERTRLQMVRACNSMVNEFFFYDNIVLVEGPTEQIAIQHVASKVGKTVHVINCLGKANIPLFARILNQFQVPYLVIHDSDTPKVRRKDKYIDGAMWIMNNKIRKAVSEGGNNCIFTQFPHFEGEFLGEELLGGKVDRLLEILADPDSSEYKQMFTAYSIILNRDPNLMTTTEQDFNAKIVKYINENGLSSDPYWA